MYMCLYVYTPIHVNVGYIEFRTYKCRHPYAYTYVSIFFVCCFVWTCSIFVFDKRTAQATNHFFASESSNLCVVALLRCHVFVGASVRFEFFQFLWSFGHVYRWWNLCYLPDNFRIWNFRDDFCSCCVHSTNSLPDVTTLGNKTPVK